jgi:hypothetical protein
LALSANDCHNTTRSSATLQANNNTSWNTHHQRGVDGDNAGSQVLHVLIVFKPVFLPRGVIPISCAPWHPWARRRRRRYLCARRFWTSWRQVDLRLVPDQVVSPSRHNTDGVDVNNRRRGRHPDVPSRSSSSVSSVWGRVHPCVGHGW